SMRSYSFACFSKWHHLPSYSSRIRYLLQLAVDESELDKLELGKARLDKLAPGLDKPELGFEHD
ncbi:hypothetical protein Tco_0552518, partial [Tanacetum coccineum]